MREIGDASLVIGRFNDQFVPAIAAHAVVHTLSTLLQLEIELQERVSCQGSLVSTSLADSLQSLPCGRTQFQRESQTHDAARMGRSLQALSR